MKITKEILNEYGLTDKPMKFGGRWVYPSEWRKVRAGELYWCAVNNEVSRAPYPLVVPLPIYSLCTLPPKPDAEWIKAHTPEGYTMTVNDEPDLESVPFVNATCRLIRYAKTDRGTDFHGLRYGVTLTKKVEPVKPVETRSCDNCGNGPCCSQKCIHMVCFIDNTAKNSPFYFAGWIPKPNPLTLADVPQLSNKETRKLVMDLMARVERLEKERA